MGIGLVLIVDKDEVDDIIADLEEGKEEFVVLGEIQKGGEGFTMVNIGVLISGSGTNLQAIIDNVALGNIKGQKN